MSEDNWVLLLLGGTLYLACTFTVGVITFRKGRYVLLVLGALLPLLWFVGALLPARSPSYAGWPRRHE
jgi:hypothetical protein